MLRQATTAYSSVSFSSQCLILLLIHDALIFFDTTSWKYGSRNGFRKVLLR